MSRSSSLTSTSAISAFAYALYSFFNYFMVFFSLLSSPTPSPVLLGSSALIHFPSISMGSLDALHLHSSSCPFCSSLGFFKLARSNCTAAAAPARSMRQHFLHLPALSFLLWVLLVSPLGLVDFVGFACLSTALSMNSFVRLCAASALLCPSIPLPFSFDTPRCVCLSRRSPQQRHESWT